MWYNARMTKSVFFAWALAVVSGNAWALVANVQAYGAKGDGVADDTAAIQKAIDAVAEAGGGKVYFPFTTNGYLVASPAREFDAEGRPVRAQLVIPAGGRNICLEGEMPCTFLYSYQVRPRGCEAHHFTPTKFGTMGVMNTMIRSTWDAPEVYDPAEMPWSVIAAPKGDSCNGRFSTKLVTFKDLEIRVHLNKEKMYPTTSAANFRHVSRVVVQDAQFCLDENVGDTYLDKHLMENPCHTVGLHASGDQNDQQILRSVAVQGFKYGFVLGEHIVADHLYAHNCEEAVVFHDSTHLSKIGMLVAQHNRVILSTTRGVLFGNRPAPVNVQIDLLNFEGGQTTGVPPWVSHLHYGIYDPENRLHGSVTWHEPWGANSFPVVGARHFKIEHFGGNAPRRLRVGVSDCGDPENAAAPWYLDAVRRAGHEAIALIGTADTNALREVVANLDVLLMTGGEDVEPARYGAEPSPKLGGVNLRRDACDFALMAAARERKLPMFGVCRGLQAMNVFFGGTLYQDLPSEVGGKVDHGSMPWDGDATNAPAHIVRIADGSRLAGVVGCRELAANSHHHQAVKKLAPGFKIVATAPDGVVEAIEGVDYPAFACQFHPEALVACRAQDPAFKLDILLGMFKRMRELASCP